MSRVEVLDPALVAEQIDAVLKDFPPQAVKTGALGNAAIIEAIARRSFPGPLIVDPVMRGKHGTALLDSAACEALRDLLVPAGGPRHTESRGGRLLAGVPVTDADQMRHAAARITELGARSVLVKGGTLTDRKRSTFCITMASSPNCAPRASRRVIPMERGAVIRRRSPRFSPRPRDAGSRPARPQALSTRPSGPTPAWAPAPVR